MKLPLLLTAVIAAVAGVVATAEIDNKRCFPDNFLFGSATAAYQVEGGWDEGGRTRSIWDDFCRERGLQCSNVADDFYHRYRDDIKLMVASGLDSFRFSISWSRVMNWDPAVKKMKPNAPGIAFYHAVLDELARSGITPILTLYHWDLPSELHTQLQPQGWLNLAIADHFAEYADLMFSEFGSKVELWTTFNEPLSFTSAGYGTGLSAPGFKDSKTNAYVVSHNLLVAHGKAVARFRELQKNESVIHAKARIAIVTNAEMAYPLDPNNAADVAAAERKMQFELGWFLSPIVYGKYPDVMRERAGDSLPEFTAEEAALVKGSYDLFMLNHYSSKTVTDCDSEASTIKCSSLSLGWERDLGIETRAPAGARLSNLNDLGQHNCVWFTGYPVGYLDNIKWMHKHDPKADILLTENGWCGNDTVDNQDQLWYHQTYLEQVYRAITEFNIPVIGYTAWSFLDNYEWGSFKPRFGLYYVNFTASTGDKDEVTPDASALARIPRPAAKWYAQVAKARCLDVADAPDSATAVVAVAVPTSSHATFGIAAAVVAVVVAGTAVVWLVKRRQAGTASEKTPLVQRA